jgi:hypothetical protein
MQQHLCQAREQCRVSTCLHVQELYVGAWQLLEHLQHNLVGRMQHWASLGTLPLSRWASPFSLTLGPSP